MRAALLGAFPFPYPQGSQTFVTHQARALARIGVDVQLFAYGRGVGEPPADLDCVFTPRAFSPKAMRSGPTLAKFGADAALFQTYLRAGRSRPFDVVFAHNAEAAFVALAARPRLRTPVIYVAHTLLRHELSAYGPESLRNSISQVGGAIDRFIARRADGIIALCDDAKRDLASIARGPVAVIPPGLDPQAAPEPRSVDAVRAKYDLARQHYALYCGNLDRYQDLDLLAEAAHTIGADAPLRIVIATHDKRFVPASFRGAKVLSCIEVDDFAEMRALVAGAQSVVLTRRRPGGFPIKLLNYMEAGKPIIAFEAVAPGFEHMRDAWLLDDRAGSVELADALRALAAQPDLRERLGAGARRRLESSHAWDRLAQQTRALAESVQPQSSRP